MAYKTILACLNDVPQLHSVLSATASIARKNEAHVIGLYVIPAVEIFMASEIQVQPVENDELQKHFKEQEKTVRTAFETTILKSGIQGEFRLVEALNPHIAATVVDESREADLVSAIPVRPAIVPLVRTSPRSYSSDPAGRRS
jgi:hypothetical protein